ncbi:MAG: hypothetical protein FWC78_02690 [Defluviitaleaceae bacterium]|nr:hypothetical protein [Defluviitaleaceae bacterium]
MKIKKNFTFLAMLVLILMLASCGNAEPANEHKHDMERIISDAVDNISSHTTPDDNTGTTAGNIIGAFRHPEYPAEQLKIALENDINERGLPMTISEIENIVFNSREYTQIVVNFSDSGNVGVILFLNRHLNYGIDVLLDGSANPSFTIAFKDHDNSQDMIMILTSVIRYLSPDLSIEEAQRLAIMQDQTISTDGFSMPQDIGGYQVQSRYTNPHVFLHTPYFDAKLGVKVRAIRQMWQGELYVGSFRPLTGPNDYYLLNLSIWDEARHPIGVYADFIVKDTWHHITWQHGRTSVALDVESMSGRRFIFGIDTWVRFRDTYEFGIGQKYTLFIQLAYSNQGVVYAVQRTESMDFNSRGQEHSIDYLSLDFIDYVRVWPEEHDETLLEVHFMTYAFGSLCIFPVLEGHGLGGGETVWPAEQFNPTRDDYTFHGWFNNPNFEEAPYTNETIIYQDTMLFPKWVYSGPGGIWPRAYRGIIYGIDENNLSAGQNITITAAGYNMSLESPRDKRFRWVPISWRLSDGTSGYFASEYHFQASISLGGVGEQGLYITYMEEVFDRVNWQQTGQMREVRERLLTVQ